MNKKFDPKKLEKLNDPKRLKAIPPYFILEKMNISECNTIVDIGAGTGLFSKAFSEIIINATIYSLDISEIMHNWIKDNINNDKIIPMLMSENKIPLENDLSDLVIMISLHHELNDPISLLLESKRILKKGGKICIIDWKKEEMPIGPPLKIRCSVSEISKHLQSAGFNKIESESSLEMFNLIWAKK